MIHAMDLRLAHATITCHCCIVFLKYYIHVNVANQTDCLFLLNRFFPQDFSYSVVFLHYNTTLMVLHQQTTCLDAVQTLAITQR